MSLTEEQVREQLKQVIDPELFINIVDLGLIYTVEIGESDGATEDEPTEEASPAPAEPASEAAEAAADEAQPAPAGPGVQVKIEMTMTSPMCPAGPQLVANSKQVVSQLPGVTDVEVKVVMDPPWTPDRMTDDAKDKLGIF